jgi:hydrogenase expression/formation protein HypD
MIRYGLDTLFKELGIDIRQGPGCPICVTTAKEFEEAVTLANRGKILATYGDATRVPVKEGSLIDQKGKGSDVRIVYSIQDAITIAEKNRDKEVVFMAVGFETTAPSTAVTVLNKLPKNFSILNCHRYVPPALNTLLSLGELKIHGLIEPGHVSTIIGLKPYLELSKLYKMPQVVAGFEPLDLMMAVYMIAKQVKNNDVKVENEYTRTVFFDGNVKALKIMDLVFEPYDIPWRGFPTIPNSGMKFRREFERYDAQKIYEDELKDVTGIDIEKSKGCRCDEILRGLSVPLNCSLFGKVCTPQNPIGPCMVSIEGMCNIEYRYSPRKPEI